MRALYALAVTTALIAPLASPAVAQTAAPQAQTAMITVTGEGVAQSAPDMATLSLGVTTQGATATEALAANSTAMAAVMARLTAAGIADADMQTANLSVNPNFTGYDSGATPSISGYMAMNGLEVRIKALDTLGATLDAAVADGANTLNGMVFGLTDMKPALDDARRAAVQDAQARATVLVEAVGAKLGRIVAISEGGGYSGPAPMFRADVAASAVPVAQGTLGITAMVTVTYEIAQ